MNYKKSPAGGSLDFKGVDGLTSTQKMEELYDNFRNPNFRSIDKFFTVYEKRLPTIWKLFYGSEQDPIIGPEWYKFRYVSLTNIINPSRDTQQVAIPLKTDSVTGDPITVTGAQILAGLRGDNDLAYPKASHIEKIYENKFGFDVHALSALKSGYISIIGAIYENYDSFNKQQFSFLDNSENQSFNNQSYTNQKTYPQYSFLKPGNSTTTSSGYYFLDGYPDFINGNIAPFKPEVSQKQNKNVNKCLKYLLIILNMQKFYQLYL